MHLLTWIPLIVVVALDMQNNLYRMSRWIISPSDSGLNDDYTILIPLYGKPSYFDNRAKIEQYKSHVVVVCDVGTQAMVEGSKVLEDEGWRVFRCKFDKPTAPLLMKAALDGGAVETRYTLRLDADTVISDGLDSAVAAVYEDGADICSMKCHVLNARESLATKLQTVEYEMAMLSRHYRPWLMSGACYIAKTTALRVILDNHTLWFLAEDSEAGRVAWQRKMRIRHLDFNVYTEAPGTWHGLFRQRTRIWWAGNFRHVWVNFEHNVLKMPVWTLYYLALVWIGLTWKWSSFIVLFEYWPRGLAFLIFLFGLYTVITFVSSWRVRSRYMFLIPYYSLIQSIICPPIGAIFYLKYAYEQKRLGRYKFDYSRRYMLPEFKHDTP
jgi:hypothetical protein